MAKGKKKKQVLSVRAKMASMETYYGSQKKLAEKLGVSTSTLNNWKRANQIPSRNKEKEKTLNRLFGHNRKKVDYQNVKKKVKTNKARSEKTKQQQEEKRRKNPKLFAVQEWVKKEFDEEYIRVNIVQDSPPYIAPFGNRGQFTDGIQPFGIPKGTKYVFVYGLYTSDYNQNEGEEKQDYMTSRLAITLRKEMDIVEALDYTENKFFGTTQQAGKRRLNPVRFIGYQLP